MVPVSLVAAFATCAETRVGCFRGCVRCRPTATRLRRSVFVLAFERESVWKISAHCMLPECSVRWLQARRRCQPKFFAGMQVSGFPVRQVQGQFGAEESAFAPMDTASDALAACENPLRSKLIVSVGRAQLHLDHRSKPNSAQECF